MFEQWEVVTSKDRYTLNSAQTRVLKQQIKEGNRGFIDFGEFGIQIAHIVSWHIVSRQPELKLEEGIKQSKTLTAEQKKRLEKQKQEIRDKMPWLKKTTMEEAREIFK